MDFYEESSGVEFLTVLVCSREWHTNNELTCPTVIEDDSTLEFLSSLVPKAHIHTHYTHTDTHTHTHIHLYIYSIFI